MDDSEIAGNVAFIAWHADTAPHEIPLGTGTFVVRGDKIAVQTFAARMIAKWFDLGDTNHSFTAARSA